MPLVECLVQKWRRAENNSPLLAFTSDDYESECRAIFRGDRGEGVGNSRTTRICVYKCPTDNDYEWGGPSTVAFEWVECVVSR